MKSKKFKMSSWKLEVTGEYESEEEAIKEMADKYMKCSKLDQPGNHPAELLTGGSRGDISTLAKRVYFYVYKKIYGHWQWVLKYEMNIYPFKSTHWWPKSTEGVIEEMIGDPFILNYEEREFKFEIIQKEITGI